MGRKKSEKPEELKRDDMVVKLDRVVGADARWVADQRGISLAEYLTEMIRPLIARDLRKEMDARKEKTPASRPGES